MSRFLTRTFRAFVLLPVAALLLQSAPVHAQSPAPSRPAITGIAFARFYETDAMAAQQFYHDTLGFARLETGTNAVYPVNRQQWIETVPHAGQTANDRLAAVGFTTRDAGALARYLAAKGYPAEQPLHHGTFAVRDPEGNLVFFVQSDSDEEVARSQPAPHASSRRIIHVGFIVDDRAKEDTFYRDVLGFKPYWHGGMTEDRTDWVSQQVPDGTDWLEYMLGTPRNASLRQHGGANHVSLGVADMSTAVAALQANGCTGETCTKTQIGRDGKTQLNLFDPDLTRIEFMEFIPRRTPCCSPIQGPAPTDKENR